MVVATKTNCDNVKTEGDQRKCCRLATVWKLLYFSLKKKTQKHKKLHGREMTEFYPEHLHFLGGVLSPFFERVEIDG